MPFPLFSEDIWATTLNWLPYANQLGVSRVCRSLQAIVSTSPKNGIGKTFPFLLNNLDNDNLSELSFLFAHEQVVYQALALKQMLPPTTLFPSNLAILFSRPDALPSFSPFQQSFLFHLGAASDVLVPPSTPLNAEEVFRLAACIGNKRKLEKIKNISSEAKGKAFIAAARYGQLNCLIYLHQQYRKDLKQIDFESAFSLTIQCGQLSCFQFLQSLCPEALKRLNARNAFQSAALYNQLVFLQDLTHQYKEAFSRPDLKMAFKFAAMHGHFASLKYLDEQYGEKLPLEDKLCGFFSLEQKRKEEKKKKMQ